MASDRATGSASPRSGWRDGEAYADLRFAEPAALAWEWLRRDRDYRTAAAGATLRDRTARPWVLESRRGSARWGLHAFADPDRCATIARPVWRGDRFPRVLTVDATPAGSSPDAFDLGRFAEIATVVSSADEPGTGAAEHLLLSAGRRSLRVDVMSGSLLAGPVRLSYRLTGLAALDKPLDTLHGLVRLWRSGRLGRTSPGARNPRQILLLRTWDALQVGASQREIAGVLLNGEADQARWRTEAPSLRSRAQRLVKGARAMADGGYRSLLSA